MTMKMKNKRNILKPHQIIALICAFSVPVLYVVSIILFVIENTYAEIFLALAIGISMFIMPAVYAVTKFPKDLAEIYNNICDMIECGKNDNEK